MAVSLARDALAGTSYLLIAANIANLERRQRTVCLPASWRPLCEPVTSQRSVRPAQPTVQLDQPLMIILHLCLPLRALNIERPAAVTLRWKSLSSSASPPASVSSFAKRSSPQWSLASRVETRRPFGTAQRRKRHGEAVPNGKWQRGKVAP